MSTTTTTSAAATQATTTAAVTAADAAGDGGPDQARYVVAAVVVSFLVSFLAIAGALYLTYDDLTLAAGVGVFAAFWGGGGFGVVAGVALHTLAVERRARAAAEPA